MDAFRFSSEPLEPQRYRQGLADAGAGGYASFEGWVRNHSDGRRVRRLEYEAYESLARKEGARIVAAAIEKFGVSRAACVHRIGSLDIGELAVWVGVSAAHRDEAFAACRYIIDEVKHRVPIWKKEHYEDGDSGWVNCERCADASHVRPHAHDRDHAHARTFTHDYSRQTALPEVGETGQARLRSAAVLVVGAGGLGVPVLQYLAASGVGKMTILDGDHVEPSNLHRQPIYEPEDVGRPKAVVAAERLRRMNRDLDCTAITEHASAANVSGLVASHDVVVECTDNLRAKFLVNDAAVGAGKPAVFASVHQYEGQLQVYRPRPDWPCLRCLWPEAPRDGLVGNCAEAGVLGPVPGTLGTMQAMQVLQLILGLEGGVRPGLLIVDLLDFSTRGIGARRRAGCEHGPSVRAAPEDAESPEVDFSSLNEAREAGFELVDIREAWERQSGRPASHITLHLPLSELLGGRVAFPAGGRYLIVCEHGVRSLALAEHLRERGHAEVYSMRGGIAALKA